tara:strand:- start:380 stop:1507 length:1128 start_codon:yes stop_codon:yes gene_type:complete
MLKKLCLISLLCVSAFAQTKEYYVITNDTSNLNTIILDALSKGPLKGKSIKNLSQEDLVSCTQEDTCIEKVSSINPSAKVIKIDFYKEPENILFITQIDLATKLIESSNSIPCNNCSTLALLGELQKYRLREGYDSPSLLKNFSAYKYKSPSLPDKLISINLTTNPPSSIFINNKNMGTSPIELSAEVNEQIEVSFLDINHKRLNKKIKFNKNQSLSFDLTPIEGSLYLKSIPPKASVFVNGKSLGKTPKEIKKIKLTESVNITLKLDNHIEQEFTFKPRSENRETQTIELERGIGFLRVKHDGDPAKIIVYSNDKLLGPLAKFANDTIVLEAGKNKVKLVQGEVSKEETFDIKMDNFLDWEVTFVESVEISISF